MWKLAWRNIFRHKLRTAMTLLAIVVGVMGLIISGGFVHDIYKQLGEMVIHSQTGHIQIALRGYFEHGTRSPENYLLGEDGQLRERVAAHPAVAEVMGRLYFSGLLSNGRADMPVIAEGVEPEKEVQLNTGMVIRMGRALGNADAYGVMLGQGLAQALKLRPGDYANIVVSTPDGALNTMEFQVVGVFQTHSKDYDARAVRIALPAAQELLDIAGVNTLVLLLHKTEDTAAVAATLARELGHLEIRDWVQLNDFYAKTVEMYDAQFGVLRLIILLMVLLSVANSVNMSAFERVGEFGTMMALGNRSRQIFTLIMAENLILGAIGGSLGVLVGCAMALSVSAMGIPMPPFPNSDLGYTAHIQLVPSVVAGSFAVAVAATVAAALLPALRVGRIPVVDALRQNV